jgi:hypothetical protein
MKLSPCAFKFISSLDKRYSRLISFPALPVPGTKVLNTFNYGKSLWGKTTKIVAQLPTGEAINYFLKVSATSLRPKIYLTSLGRSSR